MEFGNKLFGAEQAAFHYSELSRENISSAMEECAGFVLTERAEPALVDSIYSRHASAVLSRRNNIKKLNV